MKRVAIFVLVLLFANAPLRDLFAVSVGQIDNFQDGTTDNWTNGQPTTGTPPINVGTGGPAGAGDRFLEITADGSGADGKLTTFNRTQWLGDYITAGVNEIDMDLENLSSVTLSIRLAFRESTTIGAPGYLSTIPVTLAPNSGWVHASFAITPTSLTPIGGPTGFSTFFSSPAELRIINEAGTTNLDGDVVTGQLGIDNIAAVPEPSISATLVVGLALFCQRRARR
jgi:hypothetical protein